MTSHDRKALLKAFYGLATLWIINGVFGLVRASGPGALLPYIEIAILLGYWVYVFNWWSKNRPKSKSQPAAKTRASSSSKFTAEEIRQAVDREEAIANERSRRRKQRLSRAAGSARWQIGDLIRKYRLVIGGALLLVGAAGLFQGYRTISDALARQAEARARADAAEIAIMQTKSVIAVWNARNNCLKSEFGLRWQDWYASNPETRARESFSTTELKWVTRTRTLPLPESLSDVTWFPTGWLVSQAHFDPLANEIAAECRIDWPPPQELTEDEMVLDFMDYGAAEVPYGDQWMYQWLSPFPYPEGPARILNAP